MSTIFQQLMLFISFRTLLNQLPAIPGIRFFANGKYEAETLRRLLAEHGKLKE